MEKVCSMTIKFKVSKTSLHIFLMIFILYHATFIRFPYIQYNNMIKYACVLFLAILLLPHIKVIWKSLHKKISIFFWLYLIAAMASSILNMNTNTITHTVISGGCYVLILLEALGVFTYAANKRSFSFIIKCLMIITLSYVIINDFFILINPELFGKSSQYYFLGNKFSVCYRHLELILLVGMNLKNVESKSINHKIMLVICGILELFISIKVGCVTGIAGLAFLIVFVLLPKRLIINPIMYLVTVIGSSMFVFITDTIISNVFVQNILINVLHKGVLLSGRTIIYAQIPNVLKNHLIFGYGYGSSYETWMSFTKAYPNSQNGWIDCVVEQGIIAAVLLIIFVTIIIGQLKKNNVYLSNNIYFTLLIILVFSALSCVEITISVTYVIWVILLQIGINEYEFKSRIIRGV